MQAALVHAERWANTGGADLDMPLFQQPHAEDVPAHALEQQVVLP